MAQRGGARPNSGAKPGVPQKKTLEMQAAQELLRTKLQPHLEEVILAHVEKAKDGDVGAIKEFYERFFGKTKEIKDVNLMTPTPILANILNAISSNDSNKEDSQPDEED